MCFEDFKQRTLNTAISGVKSFAKNNGKQMAFSSRNHLKIQEHVGLPLEICFPWPRFVSCLWDLHLTAWFQRCREVRYRLEIAISIPHWRLAVWNGFCSSDQLRQMVLIQNQSWLISSYTKPTLSVTLWSSRHLRGLHTFCGTTMDEWLSKSHPFR